MKKIFLIGLSGFFCVFVKAQLNTNLVLSATPPGTLIDWAQKKETLSYIIVGNPGASGRFIIKSQFKLTDGTVIGSTNLAKAKEISVSGGTLVLSAAEVIPLEAMVFTGNYNKILERTGRLPSGTYQLCVQLVTPINFQPASAEQCRTFTLAAFQLPIPVMPANEDVLDADKAQTAITFRWTPVTPRPTQPVKYIVTVFEVLDKQTPMQALRSNQPLLTKEIMGSTQFIWQPQLSFDKTRLWAVDKRNDSINVTAVMDSIDATTFIWTIQTIDNLGRPFGDGNVNGDGISEPNVFTVIKDRRKMRAGPPARIIYKDYLKGRKN